MLAEPHEDPAQSFVWDRAGKVLLRVLLIHSAHSLGFTPSSSALYLLFTFITFTGLSMLAALVALVALAGSMSVPMMTCCFSGGSIGTLPITWTPSLSTGVEE